MEWCSYYRLRDGETFAAIRARIAQEAAGYTVHAPITFGANGVEPLRAAVFHKIGYPPEPGYLAFAGTLAGAKLLTGAKGISHSAVILVEFAAHLYVLTFGSGQTVAIRLPIERRFGKIVVSNGKAQDELRSITAKVHGSYSKTRIERRGKGGPTRVLEVPRNAHMASGIAAKFSLGQDHVATGDRAIRTQAAATEQELRQFLTTLESLWNGGSETDPVLAGYDRVTDIHDTFLITLLDDHRRAAIVANNHAMFSLCLDDEEIWQATELDYLAHRKRLPILVCDVPYIFGALHAVATQPPPLDPLAVRYEAQLAGRATTKDGYLADLLGFECSLPGHTEPFFFECGGWFQAKAGWRAEVLADVHALEAQSTALLAGHALPTLNPNETEDNYITRTLACGWPGTCHKFHMNYGPVLPHLETCDIMHDGRQLFFIKRDGGRSACGDVTQQASDAANALAGDTAFLQWVNGEIQQYGWALNMGTRQSIVFAVVLLVGKPNRPLSSLSIRAQDALSGHLRGIERLGFKAAAILA